MANDPYKYFRIEARELIEQLARGLLDLENGQGSADTVPMLLRLAHTLKGAARVVRRADIAEIAHGMEGVLSPLRDAAHADVRDQVSPLLVKVDELTRCLRALDPQPAQAKAEPAAQPRSDVEDPRVLGVTSDLTELDSLLEGVSEASVQLGTLERSLATTERLQRLSELLASQFGTARSRTDDVSMTVRRLVDDVRVQAEQLSRELSRGLEQVDRELAQVRATAERLRLVPARRMFTALERTARDAAVSQNKRVKLEASGGDVRLDAQVLRAVESALVQAVRNAVAHGVESESERVRKGKTPLATIELRVERRGRRIAFICGDDGAGIDLSAVKSALVRGGRREAELSALDADGLMRLLLQGGVSTSAQVTEVAGRGIGLDLIRDVAQKLSGTVSMRTRAGQGTTLELLVPPSTSSLDALLVRTGGRRAALPLDAVERALRIPPSEILSEAQACSIVYEGKVVPFAPLSVVMGVPEASTAPRTWTAVLVRAAGSLAALGVDALEGTENLVLRPLPPLSPAHPVVLGASLDAAGDPQLVLDPAELVELVARPLTREGSPAERAPILVIDDSLTTRMLEQSILESAGYEVDLAASAEEGLEQARRRRYGLFLVDVEMPGMDGFEFVATTRGDPVLRDVPAILVTSRNAPEDKQRGRDVGAQAYVVKSEFDQVALLERIRSLVGAA